MKCLDREYSYIMYSSLSSPVCNYQIKPYLKIADLITVYLTNLMYLRISIITAHNELSL